MSTAIGVDVGGTFTDFVAIDEAGRLRTWKRLSTPSAPEASVLRGLGDGAASRVVHGSTVATNALLERKGAHTALVVTRGFADVLEIRRQVRPRIYDLEPRRPPHVVARNDVIEVDERLTPTGDVVRSLADAEIERVVAAAKALNVTAVAVCLLYGFAWPAHERRLAAALRAAGFDVCASHEVLPEHREYERASTTAINAFLRPTVKGYLARLAAALPGLRVIHSGGGLAPAAQLAEQPVSLVTSGPAGGVLGALAVARAAGFRDVITFDMGGTSTDVSICPAGEPLFRTATEVDDLALHTPMIDIVTVGAGGGSIASLDAGGGLRVGPRSAGADPGPACYGSGTDPTVSDANAVLGRLRPEQPLAGTLQLDLDRAHRALSTLGDPRTMARAIIEVVNATMATALRRVSLERGFDPAEFTLVAFGGAGPLHACELAADLGIGRVLIPRHPGVLSALGMLAAPLAIERSAPAGATSIDALVANLVERATAGAATGGWTEAEFGMRSERWFADVRYRGQAHELRIALAERPGSLADIEQAFHHAYERRFGYAGQGAAVEIVNLRLRIESSAPPLPPGGEPGRTAAPARPVAIQVDAAGAMLHHRDALPAGARFGGPAVVIQSDATTFVPTGWTARVDHHGNLLLEQDR